MGFKSRSTSAAIFDRKRDLARLVAESTRLRAKSERSGWSSLTAKEANFLAVDLLLLDQGNGGFEQYYFNSWSEEAARAAIALRLIGATTAAEIVAEANAVFGPNGPPKDRHARVRKLDELCDGGKNLGIFDHLDTRFFEYPDDIEALLWRSYFASADERPHRRDGLDPYES